MTSKKFVDSPSCWGYEQSACLKEGILSKKNMKQVIRSLQLKFNFLRHKFTS